MESNILSAIGLSAMDPAIWIIGLLAIIIVLLIVIIYTNVKVGRLNRRCDDLTRGKNGKSLEEIMNRRFDILDRLDEEDEIKSEAIDNINMKLKRTFQKCGIRKYDAFNEMGGQLSFALVLLDERDCGFVINAVHNRENSYTYIKEIIDGVSAIPLSEEEQKALDSALAQ